MADIKTRDAVKGTIKTIDKAAVASERMKSAYPDILTVDEMSKALGVSTKTGYQLLRENKIEHLKVGRAYKVPKAHLLSYLRLGLRNAEN